jgi:hypothetical protein
MTQNANLDPYVKFEPGQLIDAERMVKMQQDIRAELAANAAEDAKNVDELKGLITNVDAPKFGGKTPDDWTDDLDKRYIKRDEPQAGGQYRRYFKQIDREVAGPENTRMFEPAVIEHKLCRYPLVEVYELRPLFNESPPGITDAEPLFDWQQIKFLMYYASRRDRIAELLRTESSDWFYWGDPVSVWLDQFNVRPKPTQKLDDLLNDFWGNMFNPGLEQDSFKGESYGHTPYLQNWINQDKSVNDLVKGGQWEDLRVAIRPQLHSPGMMVSRNNDNLPVQAEVQVFHTSMNVVEIRVTRAMDLMVLIRT